MARSALGGLGPTLVSAPDNPAAFACANESDYQPGMSMRDYFAGQALAGLLASDAGHGPIYQGNFEVIARASLEFADAMLTWRTK